MHFASNITFNETAKQHQDVCTQQAYLTTHSYI